MEVIKVTAQKVSQDIQTVPIAITAFTADAIQSKAVTDLHGLSNYTPNVNIDSGSPFSGDSSVLSASIRGIGQDDFAFNLDPGVGVYLDGIYLARTIGSNVDLLDVQRIEIVKGPQGTLFGRNTIGGAISIVTRDPGDQFMMKAQGTLGSFNRIDLGLTADIPLSSNVLTSFTIEAVRRDGYQKVIPFPNVGNWNFDPVGPDTANAWRTSDRLGGQGRQAVRGKLLWNISPDMNLTIVGDWTHQDQSSTPNTVLQTWPDTPQPAGGAIAGLYMGCVAGLTGSGPPNWDNLCTLPRMTGWPPGPGLAPIHGSNLLPILPMTTQTGNIDTTYANGPNYAKYDTEGVGVTFAWNLDPDMTFKSITGYRHITWNIGIDLDGSANHGQFLTVTDQQQQQQFTQEFQLVGNAFDSKLNYVFGLYYFYENGHVWDWVPFDGGLLSVEDSHLNLVRTSSYAGFMHADYQVTDQIGLTFGARYSIEKKHFVGGQQDLNGLAYKASGCYPPTDPANLHFSPSIPPFVTCQDALGFPVPGQPFRYFPAGSNSREFDEFTPTAGIQFHATEQIMAYFTWSKGFKSGGWTTRLSSPITDAKDAQFDPEKASTYEVGVKSTLLDNRLQANLALFYTDYQNIQLNQQVGASPVLKNLGNANIYGAEFEGQALFGYGFSSHFSVGYLDAYYTHLDPSVHPDPSNPPDYIAASDVTLQSKLPKTPMWKVNLNPQFDADLGDNMGLVIQAAYTHVSTVYNNSLNTPLLKRPTMDLLDASVQVNFANDRYGIVVGGTNLTDKRYITTGQTNYAAGFVSGTYSPPAQWYLILRMKM
jgi:iron complex outermembrane receptor protein